MAQATSFPVASSVLIPQAETATRAAAEEQQRWASSSVLSQGRWVKIRVEREGIYNLSADFLRRAGFSQPERVKVFGYGGLQQDERLLFDTESESVESQRVPDDLVEVPTLREGNQLFLGRRHTTTQLQPKYWQVVTLQQLLFALQLLLPHRGRRTFAHQCSSYGLDPTQPQR